MNTKTISISSIFPASPDEIWAKITLLETLRYIAAPYAYFSPLDSENEPEWCEGKTMQFRLNIFGIFPVGIHTIKIIELSKEKHQILSTEKNQAVPVWNHTIILKPLKDGTTRYEDIVEIGAGWKTNIISLWSKMFYRHRQKRWQKLL